MHIIISLLVFSAAMVLIFGYGDRLLAATYRFIIAVRSSDITSLRARIRELDTVRTRRIEQFRSVDLDMRTLKDDIDADGDGDDRVLDKARKDRKDLESKIAGNHLIMLRRIEARIDRLSADTRKTKYAAAHAGDLLYTAKGLLGIRYRTDLLDTLVVKAEEQLKVFSEIKTQVTERIQAPYLPA